MMNVALFRDYFIIKRNPIIQFNTIVIYLHTNLTDQRPSTKLASGLLSLTVTGNLF
jgi:hypothetical protein